METTKIQTTVGLPGLKSARESRGVSLNKMSYALEISSTHLYKVERGQKQCSKELQERVSDYLSTFKTCSTDELLGRTPPAVAQ